MGALPARVYAAPPPAMARRRQSRETLSYGVYTHSNRVGHALGPMPPLPPPLAAVSGALVARGCLPAPAQACSVNCYAPGEWLPPHVDSHSPGA